MISFIAIPENNAIKTVQQSAKDKEGICRRADARQRYLTQDALMGWIACIIFWNCYNITQIEYYGIIFHNM